MLTLKKPKILLFCLVLFAQPLFAEQAPVEDRNLDSSTVSPGAPDANNDQQEGTDDETPLITDQNIPGNKPAGPKGKYSGSMLDMLNRVSQLESENRQLRGQIEILTHDIKSLKQRQRELYIDIDARLRKLELKAGITSPSSSDSSAVSPAPGTATSPAPAPGPASKPGKDTSSPGYTPPSPNERQAYQRAFSLLRRSRYRQAIRAFNSFLKKYPRGSYSDNARYWLSEAYYVTNRFKSAAASFRKLIKDFPRSPKVVSAKLKLGYSYYEMGQYSRARKILRGVVKAYPNTSSARLARKRLNRMRKERKR